MGFPNPLGWIKEIVTPVRDIVDEIHTSAEEKAKANEALAALEVTLQGKYLDYYTQLINAQASIIKAEAEGQSWLQRNWRPVLMTAFTTILMNNYVLVPWLKIFTDG